ncbi:hypothetical protein Dda_9414 [Drechslerella dactyloides]|uniref:Uncharacterized protein n=1 Tax=Drechslerella dactyloides TaxID=74499 RepID=A0AAD6NF42_DREDA|nr:hypothetical protein Dda_9414 [Drechslerella dactyloides]
MLFYADKSSDSPNQRFFTYSVDTSTASPEAAGYITKMWTEPKLKKIGRMQFDEVADHPEYNVPHYDNFVPSSSMIFWNLDDQMS